MKNGDLVTLDADFNNTSIVKLVSLDKIYSLVKDTKTGQLHEVMTSRLTEQMNTTNNYGPGDDNYGRDKRMTKTVSEIEMVETAAEKYYWSDEAQVSANSLDRINDAFIAGANWQKSQSGLVEKAKVVEVIQKEMGCEFKTAFLIEKINSL